MPKKNKSGKSKKKKQEILTLELVREEKLYRLIPDRNEKSRLEASGVALYDDSTALVIFDNLNWVAAVDLSFKNQKANKLFPAPSLSLGFEDIAIDRRNNHFFCLIEQLEDFDGSLCGFVAEYDTGGRFMSCTRLPTTFEDVNKGFEGLAHIWVDDKEYLYALCEGNLGTSAKTGGGRVDVFTRSGDENWKLSHHLSVPSEAEFEDYAALSYRDGQIAIVSQASARVWVARIDEQAQSVVPGSGRVYRFPNKSYGNIEGIAWQSPNILIAVSDRKKKNQAKQCSEKDQSIHIFRIPESSN